MVILLRIYFLGLIAFVPSADLTEVTALLVDARDGYALSDGSWLVTHKPVLLARADGCEGSTCLQQAQDVADSLFRDDPSRNLENLMRAIKEGAAWELRDSDLDVKNDGQKRQPLRIAGAASASEKSGRQLRLPSSIADMERFDWLADVSRISPSAGKIDPDVLRSRPTKGLIVSRLRLDAGFVKSYRLVALNDDVVPLSFRPIRELVPTQRALTAGESYTGALADWMVAEIEISAPVVELRETDFNSGSVRVIRLSPERQGDRNVVEVALVNLPEGSFSTPPEDVQPKLVGKHFEMFYELADKRPPNRLRPVPFLADRKALNWPIIQNRASSRLLDILGRPRGPYGTPICPGARFLSGPLD